VAKPTTRWVTVHFFRIARFDGKLWAEDPIPRIMQDVPEGGDSGAEYELSGNKLLLEGVPGVPDALTVSNLRDDALIAVAQGGHTRPIELEDDEEVALQTHVRLLPGQPGFQKRVAGLIRSNVTPGHGQVASLLSKACGEDIYLAPLLRDDPTSLVRLSTGVTKIDFRYAEDQASVLGIGTDGMRRSAAGIAGIDGVSEVEMSIHYEQNAYERARLKSIEIAERLGEFVGRKPSVKSTILDENGRKQVVDLVEDQLSRRVSRQIPDGESRTLSSTTAAALIVEAYDALFNPISVSLASLAEEGEVAPIRPRPIR
jgi:hypothetical protein